MQLEPTGERMIEEFYLSSPEKYLIYLFHIATYNFARNYVIGRQVLDYGCGSGYGTRYIATDCANIIGVDIAADAIEYARTHYQSANLTYQCIDPADRTPLPFADASFDTVLSFQVIEHIPDAISYLSEIHRLLKPGGVFICATPDRSTRLLPRQKPWNIWHLHEYDAASLACALAMFFPFPTLLRMGGRRDVLDIEISRTRRLMWLTLPVTLPFIPETIRIAALKLLRGLVGQKSKPAALREFPFSEQDLVITPDVSPSVNLVAVAYKS